MQLSNFPFLRFTSKKNPDESGLCYKYAIIYL